ncbi:hypothetical protein E4T52_15252 [Aureobasidium sp. EXF-3400]|nr:hypothetical protein E4T51_14472 [Aureobasidium sp. EXF-12344]KAI4769711.1 hypothetical protein E4T52_15252 [Aureobasidium sp. EXF-3400]
MAPKQKQLAEDSSEPIYFSSTREKPYGIFSQWRRCTFIDPKYPDVEFNCAEQYMMYSKAQTFNSPEIAAEILTTTASAEQKKLGRKIKNFSDAIWDAVKFGIVERGNLLKFEQNEEFKKVLLDTGDRLLVEAAASDKVWGIGYTAAGAKKVSRERWGQNLLGKALMNVREKIRAGEAEEDEDEEDEEDEESVEEVTDDEADEAFESLPANPNPSTKNKKRKHEFTTDDEIDEPSKPKKTPSKKARTNTSRDVNEGLYHIFHKTKGKHDEDDQTTEDDLLEMFTKKAVEDSMVNGSR